MEKVAKTFSAPFQGWRGPWALWPPAHTSDAAKMGHIWVALKVAVINIFVSSVDQHGAFRWRFYSIAPLAWEAAVMFLGKQEGFRTAVCCWLSMCRTSCDPQLLLLPKWGGERLEHVWLFTDTSNKRERHITRLRLHDWRRLSYRFTRKGMLPTLAMISLFW